MQGEITDGEGKVIHAILGENPELKEIVIRHGEALPQPETKQKVTHVTGLNGPLEYATGLKHTIEKRAIALVSKRQQNIQLTIDESDPYSVKVHGKLAINPDLEKITINTGSEFTIKSLEKHLRPLIHFFESKETYRELLQSFRNCILNINKQLTNNNEYQGNRVVSENVVVENSLIKDFRLNIPVYEATENSKIDVQIRIDEKNGNAVLWLESEDLYYLKDSVAEDLINKNIDGLSKLGVTCLMC